MSNPISLEFLVAGERCAPMISTGGASQAPVGVVANVSSPASGSDSLSTTSPANPLVQDLSSLFQALAAGNVSEAQSDIIKIKADLSTQKNSGTTSRSTVKAETGDDSRSAEKASSAILAGSSVGDASGNTHIIQSTIRLEALLSQISSSLAAGGTGGALQDLASFLVQNGQVTGNLVDSSA